MCETLRIGIINITCPASPECSKTSTMSNIVKSAKFVFKLMTGPVTTTSSTAGQSVMRKTSCPHDLCSCIVVTRFVQQDSCIVNNGLHQGFTDTVSDLHGFDVDKITFHGMQKNIYTATFGLIFRQSIGESRVHQSEFRATEVTAGASAF